MNRVLVNSATFNGSALAGVLFASAVFVGSAGVTAVGAYLHPASVTLSGISGGRVAPIRVTLSTPFPIAARATLTGRAGVAQTGGTALTGVASLRAAVVRDVSGSAAFSGSALLQGIVASKLGETSCQATADLVGDAARTQFADTALEAKTALLAGLPHVQHGVQVPLIGVAGLYAEEGLRYCATWADWLFWDDTGVWAEFACYTAHSARSLLPGQAALTVDGIRQAWAVAAPQGTAQGLVDGQVTRTLIQWGVAVVPATATLLGRATLHYASSMGFQASADLVAVGTRNVHSLANHQVLATLSGSVTNRTQGTVPLSGTATLRAVLGRGRFASASPAARATLAGTGVRRLWPTTVPLVTANLRAVSQPTGRESAADLGAVAEVVAAGHRLTWITVFAGASAALTAEATQFSNLEGAASPAGQAVLAAEGLRTAWVFSVARATAGLTVAGVRRAAATSSLSSSGVLLGAPYLNIPEADPSTVVLVRPVTPTTFTRPQGTTDFVRSA